MKRQLHGKKLPLDLIHHEPLMQRLSEVPGDLLVEQRIALTADFRPTGFFDKDVWVRGIIDFAKVNGRNAVVIDYKTGKLKDGFEQLDLMTAMVFCILPEVETISTAFYWTKEKLIVPRKYSRADLPTLWSQFLPRVDNFQRAVRSSDWPARPNYLCRAYCNVKTCPHYKQGR